MKQYVRLVYFALLCSLTSIAQQFPVQVFANVIPPAPVHIYNYADAMTINSPLRVRLLLRDLSITNRRIRLKVFIEGNGLKVQSRDQFIIGAPLFIDGGSPLVLNNTELAPYFELRNLQGIANRQYGQTLREGAYQFCFEVYDFFTNRRLSRKSCATTFIFNNDPPLLNIPFNKSNIEPKAVDNIVFQWTPRQINVSNVEYEFSLVEIWDDHVDPNTAFLTSPPIFTTTTRATSFIYGPAHPLLLHNKRYAWRVQAKALKGSEEIGLFRNEGKSEVFWFSKNEKCPKLAGVHAEPKGISKINVYWEEDPATYSEYTIMYRQKDRPNSRWFHMRTNSTWATVWDLKPNTTYEYKVAGKCKYQYGEYSAVQYITTGSTDGPNANYNCGIVPEAISITNREGHPNLLVGDRVFAGNFMVYITDIISQSNGVISGNGFVAIPYLERARFGVTFDNILVNTDYQLAEGEIVTIYDPSFGEGATMEVDINTETIITALEDLWENFTGSEEQIEAIKEQNQELLSYEEELLNSEYVSEEVKEELRNHQQAYEESIDDSLLASSEQTDAPQDTFRQEAALQAVEESMTKAEDQIFVGEAYDLVGTDASFKEVFENLKKIVTYFKETGALCKEKGWSSYQNKGIVPLCIWEEAKVSERFYYTQSDIPYVSGVVDGLYQEVEGLVLLPKMLHDLKNGLNDFIYAYTLAYIDCSPLQVKINENRLGLLLHKLEENQKSDTIWSWVKEQWYSVQNYIATDTKKECKDAQSLRNEINQFKAYISEIENIKQLLSSLEPKLRTYFSNIEAKNNIGRYESGQITVVVGSLVVSGSALIVAKIGKIKTILKKMTNFTKSQWDEFFEKVGVRLNKGNAGGVFKQITKAIAKQELPTDFVNALKKMDFTEDEILKRFTNYHNENDFRFFNEVGDLMKQYPRLNKTDVNLLWGYTTNIFYKNLNLWLREGVNVSKTKAIKELLNTSLTKLNTFNQTLIYRGIGRSGNPKQYLDIYTPNSTHTWDAFTSCGSSIEASFISKSDVIFEIKHLDAKDISDFADGVKFRGYPPHELLIKSGAEFKVISNTKIDKKTGKPIIELIQIK